MQTAMLYFSDFSNFHNVQPEPCGYSEYEPYSWQLSSVQQMALSAPLAGTDAAAESTICDMDAWATEALQLENQPSPGDSNNNCYSSLEPTFPPNLKFEEDFSLDDSNPIPIEPPKTQKRIGRPPGRRSKRSPGKEKPPGRLWKFILKCLEDPICNPTIITWVDKTLGTFRFVQSDKVAQRWGDVKRNPSMTYEKMSRALRYYKSGAFAPISQRLVYAFGKNVPWNSDNDRRLVCPR